MSKCMQVQVVNAEKFLEKHPDSYLGADVYSYIDECGNLVIGIGGYDGHNGEGLISKFTLSPSVAVQIGKIIKGIKE
jgi:hypothetical protein